MTGEMTEHLAFTREDADRLTRMETLMEKMDGKIDDLAKSISLCQTNCSDRRSRFGKRLDILEDMQKEETGFLKGRKADVAIVLGAVALIGSLLSIWRYFYR